MNKRNLTPALGEKTLRLPGGSLLFQHDVCDT